MAIKTKVTVDNSSFNRGMDDAAKKAQDTKNAVNQNTRSIANGLRVAGSEAGGLASKVGALGKAFTGGWISIVVAGLALIATKLKEVWDNAHETFEELKTRLNFKNDILGGKIAGSQQDLKNVTDYISTLQEMNKLDNLSNDMKSQQARILKILADRYGILGISIDKTTGKLTGLDKAQEQFTRKQLQQQKLLLGQKLNNEREIFYGSLKHAVDTADPGVTGRYIYDYNQSSIRHALKGISKLTGLNWLFGTDLQWKFNSGVEQQSALVDILKGINMQDIDGAIGRIGQAMEIMAGNDKAQAALKQLADSLKLQKQYLAEQQKINDLLQQKPIKIKQALAQQEKLNAQVKAQTDAREKTIKAIKQGISNQLLKAQGNERQLFVNSRMKSFQNLGLPENSLNKISSLFGSLFDAQQSRKIPMFRQAYETNELTARGGFAGGAVKVRETFEQEIKADMEKTVNILTELKQIINMGLKV